MTENERIQQLAAEVLKKFIGKNPRGEYKLTDDAPEWLRDAVYEAHGEILPDDFIYRTVAEVIAALAEGQDPDELHHEPDYSYSDLLAWVGSHSTRWGRVDETLEEYDFRSLSDAIQFAQMGEKEDIAAVIVDALRERIDEEDE